MEVNITQLLEGLSALKDELVARELGCREMREAAVPDEVKARLAVIDAHAETILTPLRDAIAAQELAVREAVVAYGKSVRGGGLQAVFSAPRITWDNKGLSGYAVAHPEITAFQRIGAPSVSIRTIERGR